MSHASILPLSINFVGSGSATALIVFEIFNFDIRDLKILKVKKANKAIALGHIKA